MLRVTSGSVVMKWLSVSCRSHTPHVSLCLEGKHGMIAPLRRLSGAVSTKLNISTFAYGSGAAKHCFRPLMVVATTPTVKLATTIFSRVYTDCDTASWPESGHALALPQLGLHSSDHPCHAPDDPVGGALALYMHWSRRPIQNDMKQHISGNGTRVNRLTWQTKHCERLN